MILKNSIIPQNPPLPKSILPQGTCKDEIDAFRFTLHSMSASFLPNKASHENQQYEQPLYGSSRIFSGSKSPRLRRQICGALRPKPEAKNVPVTVFDSRRSQARNRMPRTRSGQVEQTGALRGAGTLQMIFEIPGPDLPPPRLRCHVGCQAGTYLWDVTNPTLSQ
jgi:hypothetical protein